MRVGMLMAVLATAVAGSANATVVIGDFETGNDGWSATGSSTAVRTTDWAATGSYSMQVSAQDWPTFSVADNAGDLVAVLANNQLRVTVHSLAGSFTGPMGLDLIISANGNGAGGNLSSIYTDFGYRELAANSLVDHTAVLSWDYSPAGLQSVVSGGLISWQITLAANVAKPALYLLDNVYVSVPEPAVLTGIALSSLGLVIRRRQK